MIKGKPHYGLIPELISTNIQSKMSRFGSIVETLKKRKKLNFDCNKRHRGVSNKRNKNNVMDRTMVSQISTC